MGFVLLVIAIFFFSLQFIFPKAYQRRTDGSINAALWFSTGTGFFCSLLFFAFNHFQLAFTPISFAFASVFACLCVLGEIYTVTGLKFEKIQWITISTLLGGFIVPSVYGFLALGEDVGWKKMVGIFLLLSSFLTKLSFCSKQADAKAAQHPAPTNRSAGSRASVGKQLLLCTALFFNNGFISILSKVHTNLHHAVPIRDFIVTYSLLRCILSFLLILGLYGWRRQCAHRSVPFFARLSVKKGRKGMLLLLGTMAAYAVSNGLGNLTSMEAAKTVDASIQFPTISAGTILLTILLARLFYHEKLEKKDFVNMVLNLVGILFFLL